MFQADYTSVLKEIDSVLKSVSQDEADALVKAILSAKRIVLAGAGRVGFAVRGFAMRLAHLGLSAFALGDATVPGMKSGDLLVVASGSGETQTILDIVERAKQDGARIALITGNPDSRMGHLADFVVKIPAPSKTKAVAGMVSVQPMTTLNEQCLGIFFDTIVLQLMRTLGETHDTMWERHSNLE